MLIRFYIKNGPLYSTLVTEPAPNKYGKWQTAKHYLTKAGDIEKDKVDRWEKVKDQGIGASGGNPN